MKAPSVIFFDMALKYGNENPATLQWYSPELQLCWDYAKMMNPSDTPVFGRHPEYGEFLLRRIDGDHHLVYSEAASDPSYSDAMELLAHMIRWTVAQNT